MRLNITAEFAKKDDCLDRMIPADLRLLVSERDAALRERNALREALRADDGMVRVPVEEYKRLHHAYHVMCNLLEIAECNDPHNVWLDNARAIVKAARGSE